MSEISTEILKTCLQRARSHADDIHDDLSSSFSSKYTSLEQRITNLGVAKSTTIYLSPDGNDETGDGTEENPFFTICRAVDSLEPICYGAVIHLKEGTYNYTNTAVSIAKQGIITITSDDASKTVLNFVFNDNEHRVAFSVSAGYCFISNLTVNLSYHADDWTFGFISTCLGHIHFTNVNCNILTEQTYGAEILLATNGGRIFFEGNYIACNLPGNTKIFGATAYYVGFIHLDHQYIPSGKYGMTYGNRTKWGGIIFKSTDVNWKATAQEDWPESNSAIQQYKYTLLKATS